MITDMITDIITAITDLSFPDLPKKIPLQLKHENNKIRALAAVLRNIQRLIVFLLMFMDHIFHGQPGEDRTPMLKDQGMPETAGAAVAIGKRMNEFEFCVEDSGFDQRMICCGPQPVKKLAHDLRHIVGRGSGVKQLTVPEYTHIAAAKAAGIRDQVPGHQAMGQQEIIDGFRVQGAQALIGFEGVFDFLNILGRTQDTLAFDHGRDLGKGQGVLLNRQGRIDGEDPVFPAQPRIRGEVLIHGDNSDQFADLRHQIGDFIPSGESISYLSQFVRVFEAAPTAICTRNSAKAPRSVLSTRLEWAQRQ